MTLKALVIVHGMGSQRRNQALLGLVRPMRELIRMRGDPEKIPDNFDEPDGNLAFDAPAWVDVSYGDMNWRVTEYWWAEEFVPASSFNAIQVDYAPALAPDRYPAVSRIVVVGRLLAAAFWMQIFLFGSLLDPTETGNGFILFFIGDFTLGTVKAVLLYLGLRDTVGATSEP